MSVSLKVTFFLLNNNNNNNHEIGNKCHVSGSRPVQSDRMAVSCPVPLLLNTHHTANHFPHFPLCASFEFDSTDWLSCCLIRLSLFCVLSFCFCSVSDRNLVSVHCGLLSVTLLYNRPLPLSVVNVYLSFRKEMDKRMFSSSVCA